MLGKYDANKVEYKDILMFFRDEIIVYEYRYTLEDNTTILLKIKEQHFCKLLALDEFAPSTYKRRMYLDELGLEKVEKEELTSVDSKNKKPKIWKTYKNRIEYFPYLRELLLKPEYVIFNKQLLNTKIDAQIILLYRLSETEYIHLFCKQIKDNTIIPITFLIHKNDKYIINQETKVISKVETVLVD